MRRTTDGKLTTRVGQFHTTNAVLFRLEVFESFCYLFTGILIGEAKGETVRASVFAPDDYWPQRLSDLFCRHKLSHQAFMAKLVEIALRVIYPVGPAGRLFWIADATYTEKPYAKQVASTGLFHRTKKSPDAPSISKGIAMFLQPLCTRWSQQQVSAGPVCW
jgi:hypothetical protein